MYLLVVRNNTHIIDLEQTIPMMRRGLFVIKQTTQERGKVCLAVLASQRGPSPQFIPSVILTLNVNRSLSILRNSIKLGIAIIAITNSDAAPLGIKYPIPANDAGALHIYKELALAAAFDDNQKELAMLSAQP